MSVGWFRLRRRKIRQVWKGTFPQTSFPPVVGGEGPRAWDFMEGSPATSLEVLRQRVPNKSPSLVGLQRS
jgi:hypothetical protein